MIRVEVAIWHPTMAADEIVANSGGPARISHSVGKLKKSGAGAYSETYCRFDLGILPSLKAASDLMSFERFRPLLAMNEFCVSGVSCVAYFTSFEESEVYVGRGAVDYLSKLGFGIVFRQSDNNIIN